MLLSKCATFPTVTMREAATNFSLLAFHRISCVDKCMTALALPPIKLNTNTSHACQYSWFYGKLSGGKFLPQAVTGGIVAHFEKDTASQNRPVIKMPYTKFMILVSFLLRIEFPTQYNTNQWHFVKVVEITDLKCCILFEPPCIVNSH